MGILPKSDINRVTGVTLIEVIACMVILAILSLFLLAACYPAKTGIKQAGFETKASNLAFAVLEAIRATPDLDLDSPLEFSSLNLSNPNNLNVTISQSQDPLLPAIYMIIVEVEDEIGGNSSVTLKTLVRKNNP